MVEDDYHLLVAIRTIRIGLIVTAVTLLLGYPFALLVDASGFRAKAILPPWLLLLPLMTSVVVRYQRSTVIFDGERSARF